MVYQNALYKFINAHAGTWNPLDVEEISIMEDLDDKADKDEVYTKDEVDDLLDEKADADDVYTKEETDDLLDEKADADDVYTKTETDTLLLGKAPVITETASGSIASFSDGSALPVESLSVSIEPVQDLHGYDNPWPAGGGINKYPPITISKTSENPTVSTTDDVYTINGSPTGYGQTIASNSFTLPAGSYYFKVFVVSGSGNVIPQLRSTDGNTTYASRLLPSFTLTEETILVPRFTWNSGTISNLKIKLMIVSGSAEPTSYAPYSNICSISGHTSVTVTRTGKNLLSYSSGENTSYDIVLSRTKNGDCSLSGTNSYSGVLNRIFISSSFLFKAGYTYYIKGFWSDNHAITDSNLLMKVAMTYSGGNELFREGGSGYTPTEDTRGFIFIRIPQNFVVPANLKFAPCISITPPSESKQYYNGTSVTIDLDGTRYGGTLDVITGEMVVDRVLNVYNGSETWTMPSAGKFFRNDLTGAEVASLTSYIPISNMYPYGGANSNPTVDKKFYTQITTYVRVWVVDSAYQTLEAWYAYLAQNNLQVCYYLATPFTVQLTPAQLSTLLGENHIFADTGDVAVTYRADTKLYIQKLTQPTEDDMIANANIASGKYFMVGNSLYLSSQSIAQGDAIVPGTNCTPTSLAEALNAINA